MKNHNYSKSFIAQTAKDYALSVNKVKETYESSENLSVFYNTLEAELVRRSKAI